MLTTCMPVESSSCTSEYPDVNIAYGFKVICSKKFFIAAAGISWNWSGGIKMPMIADISGILNVFVRIGTG